MALGNFARNGVAKGRGRAYKRLFSLVKNCLKKIYGLELLDNVKLRTALCQIEDTINSRPLTYVSDELPTPLKPNHFLRLRTCNFNSTLEVQSQILLSDSANLISS